MPRPMTKRKLLGHAGVDSGQLIIVDPCYLSDWKDGEAFPELPNIEANHYSACCDVTLHNPNQGGEVIVAAPGGQGVVATTGIGDGNYPIYAEYLDIGSPESPDIRISKLIIDFQLNEKRELLERL